MVLYYILCC